MRTPMGLAVVRMKREVSFRVRDIGAHACGCGGVCNCRMWVGRYLDHGVSPIGGSPRIRASQTDRVGE